MNPHIYYLYIIKHLIRFAVFWAVLWIRNRIRIGFGTGTLLDPYSGALWIRIRIRNTDQDPHM